MKIAIVINTSWNIYNFRMGLIKSLKANGIEVYTIAPEDDFSPLLIENDCNYTPVKMDNTGTNPLNDIKLTYRLFQIYKKIRPDLILHFTIKPNIYGTAAATMLGIPVINNVCGLGTIFMKKNLVNSLAKFMYKLAFKYPKKVFFQNGNDRDLFIKQKLIREEITELVPGSGIDLTKFIPKEFKKNKDFTFLLISRLIYDKGIVEYVEAIKSLKSKGINARFQLLGAPDPSHKRGITTKMLEQWINSDIIEYLGTTDDVRKFIDDADCIVLPSYREGTPRTLLEAASSGKPIVATDVPGCNHVVENNYNGFLCNLKDAEDLAVKMYDMLLLKEEALELMGKNGRRKVEMQFDEKFVVDKYLESIRNICA